MSNACPQLGDKIKRQLKLEEQGISDAMKQYRETQRKYEAEGKAHELPPQMRLMSRLLEPTMDGIDLFKVDRRIAGRLAVVRPILMEVPTPELAYITLRVVLDMISDVQPLQRVAIKVGQAVEEFIDYCAFKKVHPGIVCNMEKGFKKNCSSSGHKKAALSATRKHLNERKEEQVPLCGWDQRTQYDVGLKLVDILIEQTGAAEKSRASVLDNREELHRMVQLSPTEDTLTFIKEAHKAFEVMRPHVLPMIVPPKHWTNLTDGGFLIPTGHKGRLINSRIKEHRTNQQIDQMSQVFDAVNALQDTKWRINKSILDVVTQLWETTDGMGLLPETSEVADRLPPKPWTTDAQFEKAKQRGQALAKEGKSDPEWAAIKQWKATCAEIYGEYHRSRSARIATAKQISIGTQMKDEDELYFVHFLDWRGRIYPRAPFVNPQSDDLGSALIEFGDGEPLTEAGVRWLAVHVANSYGYDKASRNDRIKWVEEHEQDILGSARDPLGPDGWFWRELDEHENPVADSPFCFLAACMAWAQYKAEGPDAIIHLPIQVDGSCNGLQHFAMALGDEVGASAVNVGPAADWDTKPSDVYGLVAAEMQKLVDEQLKMGEKVYATKEMKGGNKDYTHVALASLINGHISRSLVKRNVMTTPYGATKRGMQGQNKRILAANGIIVEDENDLMIVVKYMTDLVYDAIGRVVVSAQSAMSWMHQVASCYNVEKQHIIWQAPSGFTVTQGYKKRKSQRIETVFGGERIRLTLSEDTDALDTNKQKQGISPNFIHSLDATHLVWTVNACKKLGSNHFSMIHDSYGTHARHMDTLARVLREEAVRLYKEEDYLNDMEMRTRTQTKAEQLEAHPVKGGLNYDLILENAHFFG